MVYDFCARRGILCRCHLSIHGLCHLWTPWTQVVNDGWEKGPADPHLIAFWQRTPLLSWMAACGSYVQLRGCVLNGCADYLTSF